MPISPLLIWVMGFEAAKAGRLPTPEQHAELRRLLHQAMDAGACGWSAQRMLPTGPSAVQRDHDGLSLVGEIGNRI
jgi:N-acyl-D-aspartate/D-glutamate deacylase